MDRVQSKQIARTEEIEEYCDGLVVLYIQFAYLFAFIITKLLASSSCMHTRRSPGKPLSLQPGLATKLARASAVWEALTSRLIRGYMQ